MVQRGIRVVEGWCTESNMQVSASKTAATVFSLLEPNHVELTVDG